MDKDHNLGILSSYNAKQERTFEMRAPPRRRNTNKEKESQDSDNQPLFLRKAFVMISNCPPDIGGWSDAGDTVIIKDVKRFEEQVIPTVYKHNNFSSFVRQLNFYGFRKVKSVESIDQPASSLWEFRHPSFLRGQPQLLSEIKRAMHYAGDSSNSVEVQELKNQVANLTDIVSRLKEQVDDLTEEVADMRKRDVSSSSSSFAGRIAPDSDIEHKKRKVVGVKSSARYEGKGGGDHSKTSVPIDLLSNFDVSGGHHDDDYAEDALDVGSLDLFMEEWKAVPENSLPGGGGKKKGGLKSSAPASSSSSSSSSLLAGSDKLDFSLILESLPSDLKVRFVDQLADQFGKQLTGPGLLQGFQQYHQPSSHNQPIDSSFYPNQNFNASSLSSNSNNNKFQGFPVQSHHMFSSQQDEAHDISLPLASAALGAFMSDINNIPSFEQFSNNSGDSGSNDNNNDNNLDSGHIPDSLDNCYAFELYTRVLFHFRDMGSCISFDVIPPVPETVTPDPAPNTPITIESASLGFFGSREFGIWQNERPSGGTAQKNTMWMWFRKSDLGSNAVLIELENFDRGKKPDTKKGMVLYKATLKERPPFKIFHRFPNQCNTMMNGFISGGYQNQEDNFYMHSNSHTAKFPSGGRTVGTGIISKWSMATQAEIYDGELRRGAASFGTFPVLLEVFSCGTVATSYIETVSVVEDRDDQGNVVGQRQIPSMHKVETEFVDRIEYRLSFRGRLWFQFFVMGDSYAVQNVDPTIDCPFFRTVVQGGWFSRSEYRTTTKPGVDSALAILIAQLCATEYSVANVKAKLDVQTPAHPTNEITPGFRPSAVTPFQPAAMNTAQPVSFVF